MALVVNARIPTGPNCIQVFVADFNVNGARPLAFSVNGVSAAPIALRPLTSARGPNQAMPVNSQAPRAFTGVYEFRNVAPATRYRVGVSAGLPGALEHSAIDVVTLPSTVPSATAGGFDVLLASCFYRNEHSAGALAAAIRNLLGSLRAKASGLRAPDCALFMGDQVYLDLPTLSNFADDTAFLAQKFEDDYRINWHSSLAPLLGLAPSACLPDDHEYWNNAPHASFQNGNTLSVPGRKRWKDAASAAYEAFAKPFNASGVDSINDPLLVTVHPLSFFLADGRSARDENRAFTLTAACRAKLRGWIDELNANDRIGVFVTGQSLVQAPVAGLEGKVADWEMPNYADYPAIMAELSRAKKRLLLLTGDVHWGRVASLTDSVSGAERVQEVIVSPASLVTTIGSDQWKLFKGWFGSNPWPRHSAAPTPPLRLLSGTGPSANLRCSTAQRSDAQPAAVKGDQLGLLSFDWTQARLRASITYFPIHANSSATKAIRVPLFNEALAT